MNKPKGMPRQRTSGYGGMMQRWSGYIRNLRKMFIPKKASYLPCDLRRIRDERETLQVFQSNGRKIVDSWRLAGNNIERTNRRNEFWTGQTVYSRSYPTQIYRMSWMGSRMQKVSGRLLIQLSLAPPENGSSLSHWMIHSSVIALN